jgi:hypothetical protein
VRVMAVWGRVMTVWGNRRKEIDPWSNVIVGADLLLERWEFVHDRPYQNGEL